MYDWRRMTQEEREKLLAYRRRQEMPWHSPPHRESVGRAAWMFSASCYEHRPHIGRNPERMALFEETLLHSLSGVNADLVAWVVLPNHYHLLVCTDNVRAMLGALGRLHGRTSYVWNGQEKTRGRKVWFNAVETLIKSDGHYWAGVNYLHQNPVKHGYVTDPLLWPFSSAEAWIQKLGQDRINAMQQSYPITDYGRGWDG